MVATAAELADREGLEAVTLAAVADRLGVRSPSLYHHVDGRAGLVRQLALLAAGTLTEELEAATVGRQGSDALRAAGRAYRRFALGHPGLHATFASAPRPGEDDELYRALAQPVALLARFLDELGVNDPIPVIRALRSYLAGFATLEASGGFGMPDDVEESFERGLDLLIAGIEAEPGG